jgi:hypothetical protein
VTDHDDRPWPWTEIVPAAGDNPPPWYCMRCLIRIGGRASHHIEHDKWIVCADCNRDPKAPPYSRIGCWLMLEQIWQRWAPR